MMRRPTEAALANAVATNPGDRERILHALGERVKELTALHAAARILQNPARPTPEVIAEILAILPPAWQHPQFTQARILFDSREYTTEGFSTSRWRQEARFLLASGVEGCIEVSYSREMPEEVEGPFLVEERNLINSIAEMLRAYFERKQAHEELERAHASLEVRIQERTAQLMQVNETLQLEIAERRRTEERIRSYQSQLRSLAAELSLAEDRERRSIATELHDDIGQTLALAKIKLGELRAASAAAGLERSFESVRDLLEQAIRFTRSLLLELSPPVLHELGLAAAVEWLAEQFQEKHGIHVEVIAEPVPRAFDDDVRITLFKAVRELLVNVAKYAGVREARVALRLEGSVVHILVSDEGRGFDPAALPPSSVGHGGFGLFNIRERITQLGGWMEIESAPGRGTRVHLTARLD